MARGVPQAVFQASLLIALVFSATAAAADDPHPCDVLLEVGDSYGTLQQLHQHCVDNTPVVPNLDDIHAQAWAEGGCEDVDDGTLPPSHPDYGDTTRSAYAAANAAVFTRYEVFAGTYDTRARAYAGGEEDYHRQTYSGPWGPGWQGEVAAFDESSWDEEDYVPGLQQQWFAEGEAAVTVLASTGAPGSDYLYLPPAGSCPRA